MLPLGLRNVLLLIENQQYVFKLGPPPASDLFLYSCSCSFFEILFQTATPILRIQIPQAHKS